MWCVAARPDSLGFYSDDRVRAVANHSVRVESPFPGEHLATDDLFILKASFLSKSMQSVKEIEDKMG